MSVIDLDTNSAAITEAIENVRNPSHPSTWCIIGFDKTKRTVKVVDRAEEEGQDDDLDELESAFNDSKCQFGFASVKDTNTGLHKFVYINWVGEGVPPMEKPRFPQQAEVVAQKFPGAHVVIDARASTDVRKSDILKKVAKASGANYSVHKEKANPAAYAPTPNSGSGYQKQEISWDRSATSHHSRPEVSGSGYQKAEIIKGNASSFKSRFEPSAQAQRDEENQQRLREERESRLGTEARKRTVQQEEEELRQQNRLSSIAREEVSSGVTLSMPARQGGGFVPPSSMPSAPGGSFGQSAPISVQDSIASGPPPPSGGGFSAVSAMRPPSTSVAPNDDAWDDDEPSDPPLATPAPAAPQEDNSMLAEQEAAYPADEYDPAADQYAEEPPQEAYDWGICATTMYDYQAQGDDEIGFDVNEVITNIEKIDEGWWTGINAEGKKGLFPANYVEEMPPQ